MGAGAFSGMSSVMSLGGALMSKPNSAELYQSSSPSFYAGLTLQQQAMADQTQFANAQAQQLQKETFAAARQKAREIHDIREQQALDFDNSGIILEGSPMAVLERTRSLGQEEIEAIEDSGVAGVTSILRQNMMQQNQAAAGIISATAQYNSGLASAKIRDYQTKASGINTALGSLNNMFGNTTSPTSSLKQGNTYSNPGVGQVVPGIVGGASGGNLLPGFDDFINGWNM